MFYFTSRNSLKTSATFLFFTLVQGIMILKAGKNSVILPNIPPPTAARPPILKDYNYYYISWILFLYVIITLTPARKPTGPPRQDPRKAPASG